MLRRAALELLVPRLLAPLGAALALALPCLAVAAEETEPGAEAEESADQAVWLAARQAMQEGPVKVTLRDQAVLELPVGFGFVPPKEGAAIMEAMGNETDGRFVGLIFPLREDASWFVNVDYEPSGYIKDDDAKDWDAKALLESLKEGTEAGNERRQKLGMPPLQVTRWVEEPKYDAAVHHLVWSAEARTKNEEDLDPTINYNTYVLGREGYLSLNLITSMSTVEADKPLARQLLSAVQFNEGKRYADFNSSTDKVAAYGLAALVAGVAAKKLGLFAGLALVLAKFAKVIALGAVAGVAGIARLFKKRDTA